MRFRLNHYDYDTCVHVFSEGYQNENDNRYSIMTGGWSGMKGGMPMMI